MRTQLAVKICKMMMALGDIQNDGLGRGEPTRLFHGWKQRDSQEAFSRIQLGSRFLVQK